MSHIRASFTINDEQVYAGYCDPYERWNGWYCPMFELEEAKRILADTNSALLEIKADGSLLVSHEGEDEIVTYLPKRVESYQGSKKNLIRHWKSLLGLGPDKRRESIAYQKTTRNMETGEVNKDMQRNVAWTAKHFAAHSGGREYTHEVDGVNQYPDLKEFNPQNMTAFTIVVNLELRKHS